MSSKKPTVKHKQIQFSLTLGNNGEGRARLAKLRQAALIAMGGDSKLFLPWIRRVLDAEADRLLGGSHGKK